MTSTAMETPVTVSDITPLTYERIRASEGIVVHINSVFVCIVELTLPLVHYHICSAHVPWLLSSSDSSDCTLYLYSLLRAVLCRCWVNSWSSWLCLSQSWAYRHQMLWTALVLKEGLWWYRGFHSQEPPSAAATIVLLCSSLSSSGDFNTDYHNSPLIACSCVDGCSNMQVLFTHAQGDLLNTRWTTLPKSP